MITVIGSANQDIIMQLPHLPLPGETVGEGVLSYANGGKGANQAVAASRAGCNVSLVAALGDDKTGEAMLRCFSDEQINTETVSILKGENTGTALILVNGQGENCIAVAPGANGQLLPQHIESARSAITKSSYVMMQCEINTETQLAAITLLQALSIPLILNYAPVREPRIALDSGITGLVVNELEAGELLGNPVSDVLQAREAAHALYERGPKWVIITLGSEGVVLADNSGIHHFPGFKITPVDTTASGDAFCGVLTAGLDEGTTLYEAIERAQAAGALTATKIGAQPSLPTKSQIDHFITSNRR